MSMESLYEYGSRAGLWRVLRIFEERGLPLTIFAVARAMQRNPEAVAAFGELGHEIACHGLRWKSYQLIGEDTERAHMAEAVPILRDLTGAAPLGWYTGRDSPHTRELVVEARWFRLRLGLLRRRPALLGAGRATPTTSSSRTRWTPTTCGSPRLRVSPTASEFFAHLRDAFDVLYAEGVAGQPKMLSVGLHCRLVGRPARAAALMRFLDHVQSHDRVWVARRIEIAQHWRAVHPAG